MIGRIRCAPSRTMVTGVHDSLLSEQPLEVMTLSTRSRQLDNDVARTPADSAGLFGITAWQNSARYRDMADLRAGGSVIV
jgi:hypothetical protein